MIAAFFLLNVFAQTTSFTDFVAKSLHISPEAVQRSLGPIDEKHFATLDLKFSTEEKCTTTYSCRGTWTAESSEITLKPEAPILGAGYPTYLLVVAVDRHRRPVWFTTIDDFRFVEVPPSRDGKIGFSITAVTQPTHWIDIPTNIGARAL